MNSDVLNTGVENKKDPSAAKGEREVVLEIRNLCKSFGDNHVLRNFNLVLYQGENISVLGQSGSGKSVLIKCIVGLLTPDSGLLKVFGRDVMEMNQDELDDMRQLVGFLFQSNALYDSMTVRENLEFPLRRHKLADSSEDAQARIEEALDNVGLLHTIDMMPSELSGGMRKRIGVARTLILNPRIILYDEPTTGLDPITSREIGNLMLLVQKKYNTSSIIISHDLATIKLTAGKVILLIDGTNYAEGSYEELESSADPRVNAFFK